MSDKPAAKPIVTVYEDRPGEAFVELARFIPWGTALAILAVIFEDMKSNEAKTHE
jgi:hypothetical protein